MEIGYPVVEAGIEPVPFGHGSSNGITSLGIAGKGEDL